MVTEAFIKEKGNIQCGVEGGKEFNENWNVLIIVTLTIVIIGFAAATFVLWKLYRHFENSCCTAMENTRFKAEETEFSFKRLENMPESIVWVVGSQWRLCGETNTRYSHCHQL